MGGSSKFCRPVQKWGTEEAEKLVKLQVYLTLLNKINKYLLPIHSAASNSTKINHISNVITVKLDSGATRHYFKDEHKNILNDLKYLQNGCVAQLPDNSFVKATYEGILNLHPDLSDEVKKVLVYPQVKMSPY